MSSLAHWIDSQEAIKRIGCYPSTFFKWANDGRIKKKPDPANPKRFLYNVSDVDKAKAAYDGRSAPEPGVGKATSKTKHQGRDGMEPEAAAHQNEDEITGKDAKRLLKAVNASHSEQRLQRLEERHEQRHGARSKSKTEDLNQLLKWISDGVEMGIVTDRAQIIQILSS